MPRAPSKALLHKTHMTCETPKLANTLTALTVQNRKTVTGRGLHKRLGNHRAVLALSSYPSHLLVTTFFGLLGSQQNVRMAQPPRSPTAMMPHPIGPDASHANMTIVATVLQPASNADANADFICSSVALLSQAW